MATYNFSTITASQALALTSLDVLTIDQGSATLSTIVYVPGVGGAADTIVLSIGARSVTFSSALATATKTFTDGSALFVGGGGADQATFGATNDAMFGGLGNDSLSGGAGSNVLQGNQGNDVLTGGAASDTIYGGADNDTIVLGASANGASSNFGQGNKGDDTINGSATDADTVLGGQGNDLIGATSFSFIPDSSTVTAGGARDGGSNFLNGNLGDDTIIGGSGNDTIFGEDGNDFIVDSAAFIPGTGGRNTIDAGAGNDTVAGGASDNIQMGDGDDIGGQIGSGGSTDAGVLDGGAGNDELSGGNGTDLVNGGTGNDTIDADGGADTISGGAGSDVFSFYGGESFTVQAGLDRITDWSGAEDRLYFENGNNEVFVGAGTNANYMETTGADYGAALALANAQIAGGVVNYVAVQVGTDVYVFADTLINNGTADSAVMLVGKSLTDIGFTNFIVT